MQSKAKQIKSKQQSNNNNNNSPALVMFGGDVRITTTTNIDSQCSVALPVIYFGEVGKKSLNKRRCEIVSLQIHCIHILTDVALCASLGERERERTRTKLTMKESES